MNNKKVLIITYYWPPAGGSAIQRILKFVKHMRLYGWEPVILTVNNGEYPAIDESFEQEIPEGIKIYKTKSLQPFQLYKLLAGKKKNTKITNDVFTQKNQNIIDQFAKWVRMNIFIPDARIGWYFNAIKEADKIIREEHIDIVFSSSPPHSLQLIAQKITQKHHLKWVADFRDPWAELVHYQMNKRSWLTRKIDGQLEKSVFRHADRIITIGKDVARCIQSHVNRPVDIIPNGYDKADIPENAVYKNNLFTITYTGELSKDRLPLILLTTINKLKEEYPQIRLQFIGNSCQELKTAITHNNLEHITIYKNYMPHNQSIQELASSNALLLVINKVENNKGIITGKIFEYLGIKRPVICIGPEDGDAAEIIRQCDAGFTIDYENVDKIEQVLRQLIEKKYSFSFQVERYERQEQARMLCNIFDETSDSMCLSNKKKVL